MARDGDSDAGPSKHPVAMRDAEDEAERCAICLMPLVDPARASCAHIFCFTCLGVWAQQARTCPLCAAPIGEYLEHDLTHRPPTKFFLPPLSDSDVLGFSGVLGRVSGAESSSAAAASSLAAAGAASSSPGAAPSSDALERRRRVYADNLWAAHVASNEWTGYVRSLTPRDVGGAARSRAVTFLRRELALWAPAEDIPALADRIVHLLSAVDVRSDAAARILAPLVADTFPHAAEHLAHELAAFLRSPHDVDTYDEVVQYLPLTTYPDAAPRGRERDRARSIDSASIRSSSGARSRSRSRSRSYSYSPSPSPRSRSPPPRRARPPPSSPRQWNVADSWVDPEIAESRARRRRRRGGRRERERAEAGARSEAGHGTEGQGASHRGAELLPSNPPATASNLGFARAMSGAGMGIRGSAERRASLLERLARVRGGVAAGDGHGRGQGTETNGHDHGVGDGHDAAPVGGTDAGASAAPPAAADRAAQLREKLLAERKTRQLREQLLARKRARSAVAAAAEDVTRKRLKSDPRRDSAAAAGEAASVVASGDGSATGSVTPADSGGAIPQARDTPDDA